ncbi:helix-turn-helix transcriptional regulator [Streptomyces sp. NPDC005202]|uniref:helix-turn-helix transcriptional regulator n=1 Tax=Streptomyces sp. NPDC005202 TaxID=3157021 RepID=UPI0033BF900A
MVATAPGNSARHGNRSLSRKCCPHQKKSTPNSTVSVMRTTDSGIPERSTAALAIRHPGAVAFLVKVFEHMWERAQQVSIVSEQHRPNLMTDSIRAAMLRMVVTGHTDEMIAARLGVSSRTVSTHIKKVAEVLGSRSRAELGYLISQRRLLEREGEPVGS